MRIACLQFNPRVGDVDNNLTRADRVLAKANPENLDLIVLPEMAFTGKSNRSLRGSSRMYPAWSDIPAREPPPTRTGASVSCR